MIGRNVWWRLLVPALLLPFAGADRLDAEGLELGATYRSFEGAEACEASVVKRLRVTGPGEATIRIRLEPYRSAGKADLVPVSYGEHRQGRFQGWALTPPFEWVSSEVRQGGRVVKGSYVEGLPLEAVGRYRLAARTYEFDVRLSPPCKLQGAAGFQQWGQSSQVSIAVASSGSSGPAVVPTPSSASHARLAGRWVARVGGKKTGDCSIEEKGGGLVFVIHRTPEERSTGRFLDATTVVADGWGPQRGRVSADGRRIEWEGSVWERVGDGAGGGPATPTAVPRPSLAGRWEAWAGGRKTGDCTIEQTDGRLAFVIRRTPEERSTGRFLDATTVVADDWGAQRGRVSADGRRIDWASSFWKRVD